MLKMNPSRTLALALFAATIAAPSAVLAGEVKGMITSHEGSTVTVRGPGGDTSVTLTPSTKIRGTSGALNVRGEDHPASDLIRGLAVVVVTAEDGTASEVTFRNGDLKTARQIAAGIDETEGRVAGNAAGIAANADRIDNVGELVAAGRTKVYFATGSTVINAQGQQDLKALVDQAKGIKGYRLVIVGRADTTGNAAANQRLSAARAAAVRSYLVKTSGVSPAQILPTSALGDSPIAQDPDAPQSDDEARRVTVTIAVSKSARR
jgi:outer membrane protein OmpA-like peptidoglycan-associated protein